MPAKTRTGAKGHVAKRFGGCCFGVPSDHWSAVAFPPWSPASEAQFREGLLNHPGMTSLPVLPMQLYEAIGCLSISVFCTLVLHPRKRFDGQVFAVSMGLYAILRFGLEFFRADDRGALVGLSTSQWIGLLIVAGAAYAYHRFARHKANRLAEPVTPAATA